MDTPRVKPTVSYRLTSSRSATIPKLTRKAIDKASRSIRPYEGGHSGRGITICAGGYVYFTNAWVLVRLLRRHGCALPIQFWHFGEEEIDERMRRLVAPYGVECVDAQIVARGLGKPLAKGWPLKPFSILHSPFQEVLALDADNSPIRNPEYLFEGNAFLDTGAIFWPDVGRTEPKREIWRLMGVPFRSEPEFESGQIVVNKALCWEPLNLAMWMNEPGRAEFFYKIIWGDKDTFRFAWHKFGFPFAMTPAPLQMLTVLGGPCGGGVMCQHDLEGERIFQHRNLLKWQLYGDNPRVPGYFFEAESREYIDELRTLWNGRIGGSAPRLSARIVKRREILQTGTWLLETRWKVPPAPRPLTLEMPVLSSRNAASKTTVNAPAEPNGAAPVGGVPSSLSDAIVKTSADAWPRPKQRAVREVQFNQDGHCGALSDSQTTFWDLEHDGADTRLLIYGREGATKPTAKLRLQADGSWRGQALDISEKHTLLLRPLHDLYPSATLSVGQAKKTVSRRSPRVLHVFSSARGLGDHIDALYACVGAANPQRQIVFHTRYPGWLGRVRHPRLEITGELPSNMKRALDLNHDRDSQLRHAREVASWYADAIEPGTIPSRPKFVDRTLRMPRFDFDRYVMVAPFSAWARRDWPGANWTRLTHLLREAGYEVVALGVAKDAERFDKIFGQTTALWALEHPPEWVADAMLGAACVIGNDSGMTHYAGLLDVPTLAIHAHLPPEFLWAHTRVRSITPRTNCTFCRWQHDRGYNSACDAACSALGTIGPEEVLRAFHELVAHPDRRPTRAERARVVGDRERKGTGGERNVSAPKGKVSKGELQRLAAR